MFSKKHWQVKEAGHKEPLFFNSIIWNVQNKQIHTDRKYISGCQGTGGGAYGQWQLKGTRFLFG